ncbi:MAG: histidine kinase [Pseudomonadota bacterium]|jgi:two-component system nitrate/nitrite sensor histidine kinase NarX
MQRFFPSLAQTLRNSVLVRAGLVMSVLALLSLASILISTVIADDISGRANAVNVSGSLRMLTFRTLSEVLQPERRAQAVETMKTFERRLLSLERFVTVKSTPDDPSLQAVRALLQRWNQDIRRIEYAATQGDPEALRQIAEQLPQFVEQIDYAVLLIEEELESKARSLRLFQLALLLCVVLLSLLAIWLLQRQVLQPLAHLLHAAKTVSQGSFSVRVEHVSTDELGQLGRAFNSMVGEIATMYGHLEDMVAQKTQELRRTNESLELLYRISQQLSASDLTLDKVQDVLREVETALELGHSLICISENGQFPAHRLLGDLTPSEAEHLCSRGDCHRCFAQAGESGPRVIGSPTRLVLPVGDGDRLRAVMPILLRDNRELPREKARVIETVGHHIANALGNMRRAEEKHRMAVLEERSVIARELHDSIAQSLSYLKIQVARLEKNLEQGKDVQAITEELKQGVAGAYRELRELIVTFRLRIDERGFNVALQETIAEFSLKLGFPVELSNSLSGLVLSGNEEMHVIRIIREALSNIERHAGARHASVRITLDALSAIHVRIEDDGHGFDPRHTPTNHFGVNIMHDRAQILAGRLSLDSAPGQGTRISLHFLPQKVRQSNPDDSTLSE